MHSHNCMVSFVKMNSEADLLILRTSNFEWSEIKSRGLYEFDSSEEDICEV